MYVCVCVSVYVRACVCGGGGVEGGAMCDNIYICASEINCVSAHVCVSICLSVSRARLIDVTSFGKSEKR